MFKQFLNAELVLFGENLDLNINCNHQYLIKDGEIIVHQKIIRGAMFTRQRRASQLKSFEEEELAESGHELISSEVNIGQFDTEAEREYDEVSAKNNNNEGHVDGFYQTDENPYNEEYYGYDIDGQYLPEQFGSMRQEQLFDSPQKNAHIPFSQKSPSKHSNSSKENKCQTNEPQIEQEECSFVNEEEQLNNGARLSSENILPEFSSI